MAHFLKFILIILLLAIFSYSYALNMNNPDVVLDIEIQRILNIDRIKYDLPAISLSIKLPNSNVIHDYVSGYYTLSQEKNITKDTLFQIGSITKTFTATIIFQLIEKKQLKESDALSKWLPQYIRWKKITIYDLLHHLSGMNNYTSGQSFDHLMRKNPKRLLSLNDLANMAYQKKDFSTPGKKYHYTNTDYILLGMIIEKLTRKPLQQVFDDFFRQHDLHNTFYSPCFYPKKIQNRMAHGYNRDGTFKFNTDVTLVSPSYYQSAGGMISTPHDLVKWLNEFFSGKILTIQSFKNMTKIIDESDLNIININSVHITKSKPFTEIGVGAGIGLVYFKDYGIAWVHAGGTPGYEAFFAYNPSKKVYIALAYNAKPKDQFIFIKIADDLSKKITSRDMFSKQ